MYDILVYLFENCQQAELAYDRERVAKKLSAAGFDDSDISEALHWLAGVLRAPHGVPQKLPDSRTSFRAFASRELEKLDAECRGFLLTLEQSGILNPQTRELVIERSLAAIGDSLTLDQLKLIVLMVLWNQQVSTSRLVAEDLFSAPHARLPN
jgi:Smg protein